MARKPTINDIAHLAGVSKATVSRVLNHRPDVGINTRERILRIMGEEGFTPNIAASGLAGRSRLIGILVPSFTWPFVPDIMRGVAEIIGDTSYELILYSVSDMTREREESDVIDRILSVQLTAGILAVFPGLLTHYVARLHRHDIPVVVIDDQESPLAVPWISADNEKGAYAAVRHLISLGHERIAHIQGPMKYLCSCERYQGYCKALQQEGLTPQPELVLEGDFQKASGYDAACKFFSLPADRRPTAIFASSDLMAYGVLAAAEEYGLQVPGDLALVGFDDITSSAHVWPALTTVQQPFSEMGQQGIKLLLSILDTSQMFATDFTSGQQRLRYDASLAVPTVSGTETIYRAGDPGAIRTVLATRLVVRTSCGSAHHVSDSSLAAS